MASFNKIIIVGNLTRDPESKLIAGQPNCKMGLASNRQYKNKRGEMVQEVCFVDIDVWGAQAESCGKYLQKGKAILVEGRLKFDSWKDMEGQTRSKHIIIAERVVFLSSNPSASMSMDSDNMEMEEKLVPKNQMERDLLDQIEEVKSKADKSMPKRAGTKKKEFEGLGNTETDMFKDEMGFKDEPPFQDDLPF